MMQEQQLCAPFTPREESSPWGLACDWHCDAAARPRITTKKTNKQQPPRVPMPMPMPIAILTIPTIPSLTTLLHPTLPNGSALGEQW
jgi:hypothetical protein